MLFKFQYCMSFFLHNNFRIRSYKSRMFCWLNLIITWSNRKVFNVRKTNKIQHKIKFYVSSSKYSLNWVFSNFYVPNRRKKNLSATLFRAHARATSWDICFLKTVAVFVCFWNNWLNVRDNDTVKKSLFPSKSKFSVHIWFTCLHWYW